MPRQRSDTEFLDHLYEMIRHAPIWAGPAMAVAVHVVFRGLVPQLIPNSSENPSAKSMFALCETFAVILPMAVLAAWVAAEIWKFSRRPLLANQHNLDTIRNLSWQQFDHLVGEAFR